VPPVWFAVGLEEAPDQPTCRIHPNRCLPLFIPLFQVCDAAARRIGLRGTPSHICYLTRTCRDNRALRKLSISYTASCVFSIV
jgi:hypothetical protein